MERNTIRQIDCLEGLRSLPDRCIDIVVTSPPYNKQEGKNAGALVQAVVYDSFTDRMSETEYQLNQIAVLHELYRVLKDNGSVFYNHKNRFAQGEMISPLQFILQTDFTIRQEIVWDRMIAGNIRGWRFWQTDERIYWLQKRGVKQAELPSDVASLGSVWRIHPEAGQNTGHPCAFPEELVKRCISVGQERGLLVLDPYMGSGTTAVVAKRMGHDYIGFELSEGYIEIAKRRLAGEHPQQKLF